MKWTDAQYDAITYNENKDVLIAAAAGSGKTAVLVERIIQKILNAENPISVDELLVLTFTEAAAAEMKNKIASAIDKELKKHPDNKHLKRQSLRVASADISTIHAYAKKIIQNNIHLTDIPSDFTIVETAENKFLLDRALDICLEKYYTNIDKLPAFSELAAGYGGIKNDNTLRSEVLRLHSFAMSMAQPEKWLSRAAYMYREVCSAGTVDGTEWGSIFLDCIKQHTAHILGYYDIMDEIAAQHFMEDDALPLFIKAEAESLRYILNCGSLKQYFEYMTGFKFARKPTVKSDDALIKSAAERIGDFRDIAKKEFMLPKFMQIKSVQQASEMIIKLYPRIKTLKNIVLMLMRTHRKLKRKNSYLDFDDLEHELIKLLMNSDGTPTEFCTELGEKYNEILVDEYQDTNNIQDTIFHLLSGGRGNIFMVGDIKQSIYSFRNASPEMFLDKYHRFGESPTDGHLIRLSNNFRSRAAVVDSVNFVFRQIMHNTVADIEYTTDEYLHQSADYIGADDETPYKTELLMTDVTEPTEEGAPKPRGGVRMVENSAELEAETIAKRIIKLIYKDRLLVVDKQSGIQRPVGFDDIVILCRTPSKIAPALESVFYKYGIPLVTNVQTGFLEAIEIKTVLSFLEIIDNPLQDIPLVAVLRSPIFGFTADELAEIRAGRRRGRFYDALCAAAENGSSKAANFVRVLTDLRGKSAYMGVDELIYLICRGLDYEAAAAAMPGGEIRKANLRLLFDHASNFERTSLKGLFSFINYLERVSSSDSDLAQGKTNGGAAVTLVTIHKSKGLEYPVVILADTYSGVPHSGAFAYSTACGIGMNYVDTEMRVRYDCPTIHLIKFLNKKQETAEEARILYVALTRAREKLIISCTNAGRDRKWLKPYIASDGSIARVLAESANTLRDWIVYAFLTHRDAEGLRDIMNCDLSEITPAKDGGDFSFKYIPNLPEAQRVDPEVPFEQSKPDSTDNSDSANQVPIDAENVLSYKYPYKELTEIPLKLTVSEIKERMNSLGEDEDGAYVPRHSSVADRSFKGAVRSAAAETGTITHFVLQHINPCMTDTKQMIDEQISQMTANGMISEAQAKNVDSGLIANLYADELGGRIRDAARFDALNREFKFLIPIDASEIYKNGGEGKIIVQGVVDCFFIEDGEIVLVDYKTDSCTAENAKRCAEKYRVQADFYARGLEDIYGMPVKEKIIYFLKPQTAVTL